MRTGESYSARAWRQMRTENPRALIALAFLVLITLAAIFAPYLTQYSPEQINPRTAFSAPLTDHFLGSDDLGRDTWSRLLYGSRVSLAVGFSAMSLSILIGIIVGAFSGFFGGWLDALLMRTTDAMMSLPRLFLLLLILTLFGGDLWTVIVVIGATSWMGTARIVRGEFLRWKQSAFVEASSALGATDSRLIIKHILPQVVSPLIVTATFGVAQAILIESAMSFLGLGVQPPTPTWGNMLTNAQNFIWTAPLQAFFPGLLILLTVLSFNFAGDGLRDALDPRQTR